MSGVFCDDTVCRWVTTIYCSVSYINTLYYSNCYVIFLVFLSAPFQPHGLFGNKECPCLVSAAVQSCSMWPVDRAACQLHIRVQTLTCLQQVAKLLQDYTASHPGMLFSSSSRL